MSKMVVGFEVFQYFFRVFTGPFILLLIKNYFSITILNTHPQQMDALP